MTENQKKIIKAKMKILYRKMERLGLSPDKSNVSIEFVDSYNKDIEYRAKKGGGTIVTMVQDVEQMLNTKSESNWKKSGLKGIPDHVVFNVEDKNGNGSGSLVYYLSGYMGIQIFDDEFNEIG